MTIASENVLLPDQVDTLVKKVDSPNFALYFDTANPMGMLGMDAIPFLVFTIPSAYDRNTQNHWNHTVELFDEYLSASKFRRAP